jgi:deazaflavin-dependent oxidoreductase (nitroreductase family)
MPTQGTSPILARHAAGPDPDHEASMAAERPGSPAGPRFAPPGSGAPQRDPQDDLGRAGRDRDRMAELPYGPVLTRTLPVLSRAFRVLNRIYVLPAIKAGLGPLHANPLTGAWMLLRTTGRRTGRAREVALGYALLDGNVYCSAGFGPETAWFRNLLVEPRVEIVLPAGGFAGVAEAVTDPAELDRAWRALIRALGVLGRIFVCAADASPAELERATANIPLVRIRTTGPAGGPADPGGWLWAVITVVGLGWTVARLRRRRARRSNPGSPS